MQEQAAQVEGDLRAQLVAEVLGREADVAALNQALTDVREAARASVERVFAQRKARRLLLLAARARSALYVHDPGFETFVANEVAALKGASADEVFALTEQYTRGGRDRDDDVATPLDAPAASSDRQLAAMKSSSLRHAPAAVAAVAAEAAEAAEADGGAGIEGGKGGEEGAEAGGGACMWDKDTVVRGEDVAALARMVLSRAPPCSPGRRCAHGAMHCAER